jgi:hypothetical protein
MLLHSPILTKPDFGLFRWPGPGLGNLLFPIARAAIGRYEKGGSIIIPTMRQVKLGTFIRRESDKRTYGDILRPRSAKEWLEWLSSQISPYDNRGDISIFNRVIRYEGMGRQFHDLTGYGKIVSECFDNISNTSFNDIGDKYDIAIHIRLGDFSDSKLNNNLQNARLPLDWYKDALEVAKKKVGNKNFKGILYSDEDPSYLIDKLGLSNFSPEPNGNALETIYRMANADILIGSRSTFSLWAQFLGNSYAIWPDGFELSRYKKVDNILDTFV